MAAHYNTVKYHTYTDVMDVLVFLIIPVTLNTIGDHGVTMLYSSVEDAAKF